VAELIVDSSSPAATKRLAERLGRVLERGDVVELAGPLGAGKTCFVQGLARGLGVPADERVASPSFTLVSEHAGRELLYHIDLYRLEDAGELEELGLADCFTGGVSAVEWMERFPDVGPRDRLRVELAITGARERRIRVAALGQRSEARLEQLR
jgi:tRNA threonylcarbamoyladenosine biosynthesis protein TsaE